MAVDARRSEAAALEEVEVQRDTALQALGEAESARDDAAESALVAATERDRANTERDRANAALQAELTERERADANRAEADRATVAASEAEARYDIVRAALLQVPVPTPATPEAGRSGAQMLDRAWQIMERNPGEREFYTARDLFAQGATTGRGLDVPEAYLGLGEASLGLAGGADCQDGEPTVLADALRAFEIAYNVYEGFGERNQSARALRGLGCTLQAQGRLTEAIATFMRARQLAPNDTLTGVYLARAIASRGVERSP